jgi:DNA end-binding protein Ku
VITDEHWCSGDPRRLETATSIRQHHGASASGHSRPNTVNDSGNPATLVQMCTTKEHQCPRALLGANTSQGSGMAGHSWWGEAGNVGERDLADGVAEQIGGGDPTGAQDQSNIMRLGAGQVGDGGPGFAGGRIWVGLVIGHAATLSPHRQRRYRFRRLGQGNNNWMQVVWRGAVAFGLVNVPVKLYSATENRDVSLHQVHAADGGRIRYQRACQSCGQQVPYADIAKAYEADDGRVVVLTDEDMAVMSDDRSKEIAVVEFVPADQVDPILFDRSYWLEPEKAATKPYVLLREALTSTDRLAVVSMTLRNRTRLAALRVVEDKLLVQTMLWPDEVRHPVFAVLQDEVDLRPQERQMASMLVESLGADFEPENFVDERRERMLSLIETKLNGGDVVPESENEVVGSGQVLDLLAALRASVDKAKASGPQAADDTAVPEGESARKAPAKKASKKAAKKAPAKKSAAKHKDPVDLRDPERARMSS